MGFEQIPGQERAKTLLRHALRTGRIAHAYLFAGPAGSGRTEMAMAFAQAIFVSRAGKSLAGNAWNAGKSVTGTIRICIWWRRTAPA